MEMAQDPQIYPKNLDRTPWISCLWLAILLIAIFILLAGALWRIAASVKRGNIWNFSVSLPKDNVVNQVKDAVNGSGDKIKEAGNQKLDQVENAIKDQVKDEVKNQSQNLQQELKQEATEQINQYLP